MSRETVTRGVPGAVSRCVFAVSELENLALNPATRMRGSAQDLANGFNTRSLDKVVPRLQAAFSENGDFLGECYGVCVRLGPVPVGRGRRLPGASRSAFGAPRQ
jgi:hypothetical protein